MVLKRTSRKELILNNVLYVLENLVFGSLFGKHEFCIGFELDKVILSINGIFVAKSYVSDESFKLSIMIVRCESS